MFNIRFYNENGNIDFGGGTSTSLWRITEADGLSLCGRTFTYAKYSGRDGQTTTGMRVNARTITLSGDIHLIRGFKEQFSRSMAVLEQEGVLEIDTESGKRRINARCCDFRQGARKGKYMLFTVQFICDDPYFEDADKTEVALYQRIPFLDSNFAFPGKFSERISRRSVVYSGTREAEPVFYISVGENTPGENRLEIINHTSGERLAFDYGGAPGDFITVDIKNCKIYNREEENLLKYLTDDSFFDGFHLYPGENDVEVINCNVNTGISVSCCFSNRYSEAVYV